MLKSLGKVTIAVPGTTVRATVNMADPTKNRACNGFMIQTLRTNVGYVYIGSVTMNRVAQSELYCVLPPPTANSLPTFSASLPYAPGGLNMGDVYVDADNANDGVLIAAVVG